MAIEEQHLAVILQATVDHARTQLEEQGGFLPFGARAKLDGDIELLEATGTSEDEPLDALYRKIGAILAEDANQGQVLVAALVANASLPQGVGPGFERAVAVQVEAPGYCRSIVVPYRFAGNGGTAVEFGAMIPEEAEPIVFA